MLADNHYYGHLEVLRQYAGVELPWPMPGRLQHGWTPGPGLGVAHFAEPWPKFVWAERNLAQCREAGYRDVVGLGAPWLYLPPPPTRPPPPPRSLLVYPFHGWEKEKLAGDMRAYADALDVLRAEGFGPITVCLYWMEFEDANIRGLFAERGFEVITNGRRDGNPTFLHGQRESILDHATVTSNRVCTATFYALSAGCPFFLYGPSMGLSQTHDPSGEEFAAWQAREFPELLFERFGEVCHRELGLRELGASLVRSPEELRRVLCWRTRQSPKLVKRRVTRELWRFAALRPWLTR